MLKHIVNCDMYGYIHQLPEIAYITDESAVFITANDFTRKLFGYQNIDALEGDSYEHMPCQAAQLSDIFKQQAQKAIMTMHNVKALAYLYYANGSRKIVLGYKNPIEENPGVTRLLCTFMDITSNNLLNIAALTRNDANLFYGRNAQFVYSFDSTYEVKNFKLSQRESECLFFLLRGKSAKEIAKILLISYRTVETHIVNIKTKFNVNTRSALIEIALNSGYMNIIPENILRYRLEKCF